MLSADLVDVLVCLVATQIIWVYGWYCIPLLQAEGMHWML